MRSLSDTLQQLQRYRTHSEVDAGPTRLKRLEIVDPNPGPLLGWYYAPENGDRSGSLALVVVLHGCTQTAAGSDAGSGWSKLAGEFGFAVLFPEQSRQNNPNLCFNWFSENDIERDRGEACSIREMIDTMVSDHGIDPTRVFITGLSAGGAMAKAMLAAYPEVFSAGAIIPGLPYGVASSVPEAFDLMRGHGLPSHERLQERLRSASTHVGPWPTISVWHGTADKTVDESNARSCTRLPIDRRGRTLSVVMNITLGQTGQARTSFSFTALAAWDTALLSIRRAAMGRKPPTCSTLASRRRNTLPAVGVSRCPSSVASNPMRGRRPRRRQEAMIARW